LLDFSLIDNLFPAKVAIGADAGPADDLFERRPQAHRVNAEELIRRHYLISAQLGEVTPILVRRIVPGALANIDSRCQADGLFCLYIDKCGRDFAIILDSQRAVTDTDPGYGTQAIRETTIGFGDHQQTFIATRDVQCQDPGSEDGRAHTKHLPGAKVAMLGS
jgi:hypothetical protein